MKKRNAKRDTFVVNVTRTDHEKELASGVAPEDAMKPGRHVFRRVHPNRVAKPEDLEASNIKLIITMRLDKDIVDFFKSRSGDVGYQTLINAELRTIVEAASQGPETADTVKALRQAQGLIETAVKHVQQSR